jgi:hypothetical protein
MVGPREQHLDILGRQARHHAVVGTNDRLGEFPLAILECNKIQG